MLLLNNGIEGADCLLFVVCIYNMYIFPCEQHKRQRNMSAVRLLGVKIYSECKSILESPQATLKEQALRLHATLLWPISRERSDETKLAGFRGTQEVKVTEVMRPLLHGDTIVIVPFSIL